MFDRTSCSNRARGAPPRMSTTLSSSGSAAMIGNPAGLRRLYPCRFPGALLLVLDVDDPGPARTARHLLRQGLQIGLRILPGKANAYLPTIAPITLDIRPGVVSSGVSVEPSRLIPVFSRAFARREANFKLLSPDGDQ